MKYDSWNIKLKYPKNPIKEIVKERMKRSGFVLSPEYKSLADPKMIHDLPKAAKLIKKEIAAGRAIGVFMDYDADGVCAGAILYKTIEMMGGRCEYYVPQRSEGYGLSREAINVFKAKNIGILVTVDCGIRNVQEVEYADSKGIGVIVTDHHLVGDKLPQALAIVHPSLKSGSALSQYSGAGVAFQLARELLEKDEKTKWLLDLASISTVADIVPLVGDNRVIVKFGLLVINKTNNLGLRYLLKVSGLSDKNIGVYELGYMIAPRLNAAGRLAEPADSFRLLVTQDVSEAKKLSEKLNTYNEERQEQLKNSLEEALLYTKKHELYKNKIIILKGDWNEGIVGLISGKITQEYHLPSIVLTQVDGKLKGSARSISKIDIAELIGKYREHLLSFGGHKQAAGLSLEKEKFQLLKNALEEEVSKMDKGIFKSRLEIDALVAMDDVSISFIKKLEDLSPFGMGNPQVTLCLEGIEIERMRLVGKGNNHLSLSLCDKGILCKAILFDYNEEVFGLEEGERYDFAFRATIDSWQNQEKVSLNILDAKKR